MSDSRPSSRTPLDLARDCLWEDGTEDQLRARCAKEGVPADEAVAQFRKRQAAKRKILARIESPGEYLEPRFIVSEGQRRYGGQGYVVFGHERVDGTGRGRPVAIKHISRPPSVPFGEAHVPFEVEAVDTLDRRTSKHLQRNLVEYLATGYWDKSDDNDGTTAVVMPRADLTLREFLGQHGPLDPEDVCRLLRLLVRVVDALHAADLFHRDLKPENVLLYRTDDGPNDDADTLWVVGGVAYRPVVADLGLAKRVVDEEGCATITERMRGTVNYMAPEQFRGGRLSGRVDVYALGVLLVECLTGKVPFDVEKQLSGRVPPEDGRVDTLTSLTREPPPRLGALTGRNMDPRLDRIARKCLRKGPARRYGAAGLAKDLGRFLDPHDQDVDAEVLSQRLDEEDLADGDAILATRVAHERRGRKKWQRFAVILTLLAAVIVPVIYGYYHQSAVFNADLTIQKGIAKHRQGDVGYGLLLAARGLGATPQFFDAGLSLSGRTLIESGLSELHVLQALHAPAELGGPQKDRSFQIRTAAFSPDGSSLLLGSNKGTALMINADDGRSLWPGWHLDARVGPKVEQDSVAAVAFSQDGERFAVATDYGTVQVGDSGSGTLVKRILSPDEVKGGFRPKAAAFSADGRTLLVAGHVRGHGRSVRCFDSSSGAELPIPFDYRYNLNAAAFSPDGRMIAVGGANNEVIIVKYPEISVYKIIKHDSPVFCIDFSPDSKLIASGSLDSKARVWNIETGQRVGQDLRHEKRIRSVAFSGNGRFLLTGAESNMARVWDIDTGRPVGQPLLHTAQARLVRFRPSRGNPDRHFITSGFDGTVRLWRLAIPTVLPHSAAVPGFAIREGREARVLLSGCREGVDGPGWIRLWDLDGQPLTNPLKHVKEVAAVALSPDGTLLLGAGNAGTVRLWDCATQAEYRSFVYGDNVLAAAFSPDGRCIACTGASGLIQLWDVASGHKFAEWKGIPGETKSAIRTLEFGAGGRTLLTDGEKLAHLWLLPDNPKIDDLVRTKMVLSDIRNIDIYGHSNVVMSSVFDSEKKRVLTCSEDMSARVWDVTAAAAGGVTQITPPLTHGGTVVNGAFSPDGRLVATASTDYSARLWDATTGRPAIPPLIHDSEVSVVSFSPDGKAIVTGCTNGSVWLWRPPIERPMAVWQHEGPVNQVAFIQGGRRLVTASDDGTVRLWDVPSERGIRDRPELIMLGLEVMTGVKLGGNDNPQLLTADEWHRVRQQWERAGRPTWVLSKNVKLH